VPGGRRGGDELGLHGGGDGLEELLEGELPQRLLDVAQPDDVDRDVEPARLGDQAVDQVLHRPLVERVDHGGPRPAAAGTDLPGHRSQLRLRTTCELDQRTGSSEVARDGATDRAAGTIDHGDLVLEQHVSSGSQSSRRGGPAAWNSGRVSYWLRRFVLVVVAVAQRRLDRSASATTSTTDRALLSSAVQARCWSRPTTTTRLPLLRGSPVGTRPAPPRSHRRGFLQTGRGSCANASRGDRPV
jgi:hypothetical protein